MKREIKFRGWGRYGDWNEDEDNREWQMIDGDSLCFEEFKPLCDLLEDKEDQEYFMQFTGLKDKNGKEIYDGDIVKGVGENKGQSEVFYATASLSYQPFDYLNDRNGSNYEVVGNIYENPELLTP